MSSQAKKRGTPATPARDGAAPAAPPAAAPEPAAVVANGKPPAAGKAAPVAAGRPFSVLPQTGLEWSLLLMFVACMWYPLRTFAAGGRVEPSLLRKDLSNHVYLVTGANVGIGYEAAAQLARQNATVVLACRDATRCGNAAASIRDAVPAAHVETLALDLASLASVRAAAAEFKGQHDRLDGLINNGGVMIPPYGTTVEGVELQMGVNHVGHFLLTNLLLDTLTASAPSRVVIVASRAHEMGQLDAADVRLHTPPSDYGMGAAAYGRSKLANILHARELARRLAGTGVTAVSLHPGTVATELVRSPQWLGAVIKAAGPLVGVKTPWEGAQTTLQAVLGDEVPANAGAYYSDCRPATSLNPQATDDGLAAAVWAATERLIAASPSA